MNLKNEIYSEEDQFLDRDFTLEELSEIILKRKKYKSVGDDKIY